MIKTWPEKPENGGNTRNRTLHLLPGQKGLKGTTFGPGYPGTPGHLIYRRVGEHNLVDTNRGYLAIFNFYSINPDVHYTTPLGSFCGNMRLNYLLALRKGAY